MRPQPARTSMPTKLRGVAAMRVTHAALAALVVAPALAVLGPTPILTHRRTSAAEAHTRPGALVLGNASGPSNASFVNASGVNQTNVTAMTCTNCSETATCGSGMNCSQTKKMKVYGTCTKACDRCFEDHFQGCLAECVRGCEEYCKERLPEADCKANQRWTAAVGNALEAMSPSMRMCKSTGFNGCPDPLPEPTSPPFDPYTAVAKAKGGNGSSPEGAATLHPLAQAKAAAKQNRKEIVNGEAGDRSRPEGAGAAGLPPKHRHLRADGAEAAPARPAGLSRPPA